MKKNYLHIPYIFVFVMIVGCSKNERSNDLEINYEYCENITDTTGFTNYFKPFSEYEWKFESYDYKVERRQLPEDVLKSLTLEELFYQCVWLDMARDALVFDSYQEGFRAYLNNFNCIQELYEREGVHLFLEEKLRIMDVKDVVGVDCWFYKHLLEFSYVQEECLSLYPEEKTLNILSFMFEKTDRLSFLTTLESPNYKLVDLSQWMLGIGNIMIMHGYSPFQEELKVDDELNLFMNGRINANANVIIKVSEFGTEFYKTISKS
ncbi:hypothetical protein [uncultured Draconibacterium sp.]|uniref:hypothetical protein n=1 Tax=uncultured Draconibacterium sp. TaxID=1573823 RepID=UPI0029C6F7EF|nr:hypothetical protein [uncultured Draconibacterium sp.]